MYRVAWVFALLLAACSDPGSGGYQLAARFGGPGEAPGQFRDPTGIAVNSTEVFVADARNARIQVFDHDGHFRRQFGHEVLKRPMNLALAGDELFVPDYFEDAVFVFGLDGATHGVVRPQNERLNSPGGVAVRRDGSLLVADTYAHRIVQFTRAGRVLRIWGTSGKKGIRAERFNYPTDVAVTPDGGFVVADGYNDRLQLFGPDGRFLRKWGGPLALNVSGSRPGWFATVSSVAVAADGTIYASDFFNRRVQAFSADGVLRAVVPLAESEAGAGPTGVAVSSGGEFFVSYLPRNEVQIWRSPP